MIYTIFTTLLLIGYILQNISLAYAATTKEEYNKDKLVTIGVFLLYLLFGGFLMTYFSIIEGIQAFKQRQ